MTECGFRELGDNRDSMFKSEVRAAEKRELMMGNCCLWWGGMNTGDACVLVSQASPKAVLLGFI